MIKAEVRARQMLERLRLNHSLKFDLRKATNSRDTKKVLKEVIGEYSFAELDGWYLGYRESCIRFRNAVKKVISRKREAREKWFDISKKLLLRKLVAKFEMSCLKTGFSPIHPYVDHRAQAAMWHFYPTFSRLNFTPRLLQESF